MLERMLGPTLKTSLWVLLGAVAVVLLIACANVANLFLVRAESRRRDLTVRRAIGASRAQLVRFQMAEAFVVALVAGVLAVVLARVTLPLFLRAAPDGIPRLARSGARSADARRDVSGSCSLVALACGVAPALRASSPDLTGASRRRPRLDRTAHVGTRSARRRPDGARARAAHRLGAAGARASSGCAT